MQPGCLARLPEYAAVAGKRPVLLVYDAGLKATPWPDGVRDALQTQGLSVVSFDQVEANPRHTTVDHLAAQARDAHVGAVIGLGGGSVLDAAKAVAMLCNNPGSCTDFEGRNRFQNHPFPFLAIPTTCGTGSEVTWVSVITHAEEKRKMSIKGEGMFPAHALVDADLLATLPPALVATTGLDALTHALEAYTGTAANPVSDALAEKAVALLMRYLPRAVAAIGTDAEAREAVMRASTLAGMAFGNADVGGVHCLSETIGGLWDLPHGLLNAQLLAPVLRFHLPFVEDRLARLNPDAALQEDPAAGALHFVETLEALVDRLGIPPFSKHRFDPADYPRIARGAVANNSNASNPQPMSEAEYLAILQRL